MQRELVGICSRYDVWTRRRQEGLEEERREDLVYGCGPTAYGLMFNSRLHCADKQDHHDDGRCQHGVLAWHCLGKA